MPMGVVSEDEFNSESDKHNSTPPKKYPKPSPVLEGEVMDIERGRGKGSVETPDSIRKLIGLTAINEGRQNALELARDLGLSDSSVSAYTKGANSTSSYDTRPNQPTINKAKELVSKKARRILLKSLSHITDDKLAEVKPRELASIARDMSVIYKDMEPESTKRGEDGEVKPAFLVYAPQFRDERHYEIVVTKE